MFKNYNTRQGFTIVELLVVIVVIGILAAITIVAFNGIQQRARESAASADADKLSRLLALHHVDNGSYPSDLSAIDNGKPFSENAISSVSYRTSNDGADYCATVTNINRSVKISNTHTNPQPGGCPGDGVNGVAAITNLVPNPSFESGSVGWNWMNRNGYTGATSTAQAYSGNSSFAITAPSTVADSYFEKQGFASVPAGTYSMKAWVYLTSSGGTFGNRDFWFGCSSGTCSPLQNIPYDRTKLNQWQSVTSTTTAHTAASLWIRAYSPANGTIYIDGIMVTAGSPQNYADGNSPNWIWNGTANNSTSTGPAQ